MALAIGLIAMTPLVGFSETMVIDEDSAVQLALSENLTLKNDAIQLQELFALSDRLLAERLRTLIGAKKELV